MFAQPPSCISGGSPCHVKRAECLTAFGGTDETLAGLLAGSIALRPVPALMDDGGEAVPMALRSTFHEQTPPRWWDDLLAFLAPLAGCNWGTPGRPVFFSSSNYGIDGLYALGKSRSASGARFSTPHGCVEELRAALGFGPLCWVLSHACVTAQIAIDRAVAEIQAGLAEKALVLSFDFVGPFVSGGFHSLKILNAGFPAPFHAGEIGSIGLGDGAAWVEISSEPSRFEIAALSTYNEMFHFTSNEPGGSGFRAVLEPMLPVIRQSAPWVKGHGTGTLEPGRIEAAAVGELVPGAPLVSWKGSLGHTLGSCAAVELAVAMRAVETGRAPGTPGSKPPFCTPNIAAESFSTANHNAVLLLCNAFGGAHAAMLLRHD